MILEEFIYLTFEEHLIHFNTNTSIATDLEAIYTQTDSSPRGLVISISMCLS